MTRGEVAFLLVTVGLGSFIYYKAGEPRRHREAYSACDTNLERIGLGFQQYARDYDDTYPRAWFGHDAGPSDAKVNYKWMDAVFPYIKDEKLFRCPNDTVNPPYRFRSGTQYGSYVINNAYSRPGDAQTPPAGVRMDQFARPSETMLLTEGEGSFQCSWPDAGHNPGVSGDDPFHFDTIRGRHGAGTYLSVTALDCSLGPSTSVWGFVRDTHMVRGQTIYYGFTIEGD